MCGCSASPSGNVSTALSKIEYPYECSSMDELVGVEDDLQARVANQHSWSSSFDQVYSERNS